MHIYFAIFLRKKISMVEKKYIYDWLIRQGMHAVGFALGLDDYNFLF